MDDATMTRSDEDQAQRLTALAQFAQDVEAANDRYMRGNVSGVTLSTDIHTAITRLRTPDAGPDKPASLWTFKPGQVIAFTGARGDTRWVEETAPILEDAPIGTYVRDNDGDLWQRTPNCGMAAWAVEGGPGIATTTSRWLLSLYRPLTVVSVPYRARRS